MTCPTTGLQNVRLARVASQDSPTYIPVTIPSRHDRQDVVVTGTAAAATEKQRNVRCILSGVAVCSHDALSRRQQSHRMCRHRPSPALEIVTGVDNCFGTISTPTNHQTFVFQNDFEPHESSNLQLMFHPTRVGCIACECVQPSCAMYVCMYG